MSRIAKGVIVTIVLGFLITISLDYAYKSNIQEVKHFASQADFEIDLLEVKKSEVFDTVNTILKNPSKYVGCTITAMGESIDYTEDGTEYHAITVKDIDGSAVFLEYTLAPNYKGEIEYPENGENIIVTGTWFSYIKNDKKYYEIRDCVIPKG